MTAIIQMQMRQMRVPRSFHWLTAVVLLFAFSPYVFYIYSGEPPAARLIAILVVVFIYDMIVKMQTIMMGASQGLPNDLLHVSPLSTSHLVFGRWWGIVRGRLWAHGWIALARLGASVGLAQYFHVNAIGVEPLLIRFYAHPMYYISNPTIYVHPSVSITILFGFILLMFSLLDLACICGLVLLGNTVGGRILSIGLPVTFLATSIFVGVFSYTVLGHICPHFSSYLPFQRICNFDHEDMLSFTENQFNAYILFDNVREKLQFTSSVFVDGGILFTTNTNRIMGEINYYFYGCNRSNCKNPNYLRYIAHRTLPAYLAAGHYLLWTMTTLTLTVHTAQRRRGM